MEGNAWERTYVTGFWNGFTFSRSHEVMPGFLSSFGKNPCTS